MSSSLPASLFVISLIISSISLEFNEDWDINSFGKLFDFNERTSSTGTAGESGTGFGLPLCYDIIKAHGGEIKVESEVNIGTEFNITIPIQKS